MVKLSSGLPKTIPASGREEDLKPRSRPPDYKSSALTTWPRPLLIDQNCVDLQVARAQDVSGGSLVKSVRGGLGTVYGT